MAEWYPIDPTLDKITGAFAALSHLENPEKYIPNTQPGKPVLGHGRATLEARSGSISILGELGVVGGVSAKAATESRVIYRDYVRYDESYDSSKGDLWCKGTRWGVGFRVLVTMSKFSSNFQADLTWAAVTAEVGLEEVSFEIHVFGFADRSLLSDFPVPGRFDTTALKRIGAANLKITEHIEGHLPDLAITAVPFQVKIDKLPGPPPNIKRAQSRLFAMHAIAHGRNFGKEGAKEEATRKELDAAVVGKVYDEYRPGDSWPEKLQDQAFAWIKETELEEKEKK